MEREEWRGSNGAQKPALHAALIEWSDIGLNNSLAIRLFIDPRVQSAIDFMTRDLSREHSLADLAATACISPSRFRHLFKAETGLTLAQYLKQMRIQAVCEKLLTEPDKTVSQILNEVGVKDESHFFRNFKVVCSLTPLEYRRLGLVDFFLMAIVSENWVRLQNSRYGQ